METIRLEVNLSDKSLDDTIKRLKTLSKYMSSIQNEFIESSLAHIRDRANELLDSRVYSFPDTANIKEHWEIEKEKTANGYIARLVNTSEVGAYVEFGTGLVGKYFKHEKADEEGYRYDVNNHGSKGWNWFNQQIGVGMKGFIGYEGKSFLYDACWDYVYNREYIVIYESIIGKYLRKIR